MEDQQQPKRKRTEEEILETALAAAAAALLVSSLNKILPYIDIHWSMNLVTAPSPLLFMLLHLVIASIAIMSTTQTSEKQSSVSRHRKMRSATRRKKTVSVAKMEEIKKQEEEAGGDAEEVNARAEAFITAFREQLRVDSFGSRGSVGIC